MKWKRLCATLVLGGMLFNGMCSPALAYRQYPDVNENTVQGKAIMDMSEAGVVGGYQDGTFRPQGQLTRAEFVKIINGVFRYKETGAYVAAFDDVSGHWAWLQIQIAQQNGYIGGVGAIEGVGDFCFAPDATLTREQVAVMLSRILKLENLFDMHVVLADPVSGWAKAEVEKAIVCGVFKLEPGNTFRATEPITRAEVCEVLAPYVQKRYLVSQMSYKQIQAALQEALTALSDLHYADSARSTIINNLTECITKALEASWNETALTREYVKTTYAVEIAQTMELYRNLRSEDRHELKADIVNGMSLDALAVLYDYFLSEDSDNP